MRFTVIVVLQVVILPLAALVAGCGTTPYYSERFGDAVRDGKRAAIINPAAGANPDQAAGLDGKAARDAMILYQSSFKAPPPVTNVINIGGSIGK